MTERRGDAGRVARGGAWLFLVTLVASGAAFFTSIYLARALGPRVFGPYSTAFFLTCCLGVLAAAGFPVVLTRAVAAARAKGDALAAEAHYREATRSARAYSALAIVLLVAIAFPLLDRADGPELALSFLLLSGTVLPLALAAVRRADLTGREAYRDIALATGIASPLGLLFAVIGVGCGFGLAGAGVAAVLAATLQALLLGAARRRRAEDGLAGRAPAAPRDPAFARSARRCLAIQAIDLVVWQRSELLFLAILLPGSAEAGYYGAAFSLATAAMTLVPGALADALLPALSAMHAQGGGSGGGGDLRRSYVRAFRGLAILVCPILAGGLVLGEPIVAATLGPDYAGAAALPFRLLLVGGAVGALGAASSSILYAIGGEGFILRMGVGVALLNVLLDLLLIPAFGAVGAAVANTATQVLSVGIGTAWVATRVMRAFPGAKALLRIAGATLGMTALLVAMGPPGDGLVPLLFRVAAGAAAYGVLAFLMGALDPADKALAGEIFRMATRSRPPERRTRAATHDAGRKPPRETKSDPPVGMPTS